jgi:N-acyl-D-amino-acid deacylase
MTTCRIRGPVFVVCLLGTFAAGGAGGAEPALYDVLISGGTVYDGSGAAPYTGDVALQKDRIAYVGPHAPHGARERLDARGKAVTPGFINMLAHPEVSLIADGRALSDLRQGVTLEVIGEDSMGPLSADMKRLDLQRQGDIKYAVDWTTLGDYLQKLERRGIAPNLASYVGAGTVRVNVLGERDVTPTAEQLKQMQALVHQAMEEGAMGVTTALIYAPNTYAKTPELVALASEAARCGGIYSAHMRSEGNHLIEAVQETIDISRASGAPAEIYHLKVAGKSNWGKTGELIRTIEAARSSGTRITADMYVYTAGATGFDAAMPPWVQDGGLEAWIARLKDPKTRARSSRRCATCPVWENLSQRQARRGGAGIQESGAETADWQDGRRGGTAARREPRGCGH